MPQGVFWPILVEIGQYLDIEKSGELKCNGQTYRQTDIFFIAVLESWDAKMDVKKFLAQSEKKTDGTHYGIIRSEGSSDV